MADQYPQVQSKDIDWESLVRLIEPRPMYETSYILGGGKVIKTEPFYPAGHGIYAEEDE